MDQSQFLFLFLSPKLFYLREITWQEFQNQILESGLVDRVEVKNKSVAYVYLRSPQFQTGLSTPSGSQTPSETNPGSIDSRDFSETWPPIEGQKDPSSQPSSAARFARYPSVGSPRSNHPAFHFNIGSVETFEMKMDHAQRNIGISQKDMVPILYTESSSFFNPMFMASILPILILPFILNMMKPGAGGGGGLGGMFKMGRSPAKKISKEMVKVNFADVAGCDEAKKEIMEFVEFLKDSHRFTALGAKIPRGALLTGPPGTGKTLLAKATAGEANVPFFATSGSEFVEMFVGMGASRVRELFKEARANAPSIIFIDEIDAIGKQRGKGGFSGGNDERESTLNQLLVEMDGMDPRSNVIILAGTNRVDVLDVALTRPGRFDRQITVEKPDIKGRKEIFKIYLKTITLADPDVDSLASRLAALTPGFAGAEISNICNEAAIQAARDKKPAVEMVHFEKATDRVIGGLESNKVMNPDEKRIVAYHEAGHAVAGWFLQHADPLLKVTIIPRSSGALGFAQYLPKEVYLRSKEQIMDMVCMALAGRASEEINIGRVTTGASDDLRRVTNIAYQMVQVYGLNERIGNMGYEKSQQFGEDRMYSEATAEIMDEEVRNMVDQAYERTLILMREKKDQVEKVAQLLLEKETISNIDIADVIGARPFSAGKEYDSYVNSSNWKRESATSSPPVQQDTQPSETTDQSAPQDDGTKSKI